MNLNWPCLSSFILCIIYVLGITVLYSHRASSIMYVMYLYITIE